MLLNWMWEHKKFQVKGSPGWLFTLPGVENKPPDASLFVKVKALRGG